MSMKASPKHQSQTHKEWVKKLIPTNLFSKPATRLESLPVVMKK